MRLYEQAIRLARDHGFVQNEGLAHEVAARFYAARGFETIANAYLRNARYCYLRWGADGKVRQLDRLHPHLAAAEGNRSTATIGSPVQQLDVASVVKASQAVSSEIVLPKLIERLMTIALENAGADRGLLILPAEDDYLIQAEAEAAGDQVEVVLCQKQINGITCPESLVRHVIRTHESVILDDASRPNLFSEDDYLRGRQTKSILCQPLIKQGRLTGLLYLENTLTSHAFTLEFGSRSWTCWRRKRRSRWRTPVSTAISRSVRRRSGAWSIPTSSGFAFGMWKVALSRRTKPICTCWGTAATISLRVACAGRR